jgi:imidazolonepropionase-like amidohydrolase
MERRSFLIAGGIATASLLTPGPKAWAAVADPESRATLMHDGPLTAVKNVLLVDGTGAPARHGMTVLVENGRIAAVGTSAQVQIPPHADVIDGAGKTVLPGLVMMHEHVFYPTGAGPWKQKLPTGNYTEMLATFPPLYLAGGVTAMRTAGTLSPDGDLNLSAEIAAGSILGPDVHVTGPYIAGPGLPALKLPRLTHPDEAAKVVRYWAERGVGTFKAYMNIDRAMLRATVKTAHHYGAKVTGHLGRVTYREAAAIGIDNLEHGFALASDFVPDKRPDEDPAPGAIDVALGALDPDSREARSLITFLVDRGVALTSTLAVFETTTPGRPQVAQGALDLLMPKLRDQYLEKWNSFQSAPSPWVKGFANEMRMEKLFVEAGGTLMAGTDPTGIGGILPGFAGKRQIQLLVEAGFSFEEAIRISSLDGARFLGREQELGSVEQGKRADLVVLDGNPLENVAAMERMPLVFKAGKGYSTDVIFSALKGSVGLN